jgi:heptosyltransferase-1
MTTPAIAALKRALPQAQIDYVVEEPFRRLVEGLPQLNRLIVIPAGQKMGDSLCLFRQIRKEKYDVLIDFHGGPRASLIAFIARAGVKIGYKLKYKSFVYDIRLPRGPKTGHYHGVESHLSLVKALGVEVLPAPPLALPPARIEEREKIDKFWRQNNLQEKMVVILHIGAGNEYRDWGEENLASLALMLAGRPGTRVVLAGASQDEKRAKRLMRMSNIPLLSLVGKVNLIELRELIGRASLFAGPDSGPMHVAAATSTPIVAVFGPTIPVNFGPWKAEATLVERHLECRPCRQKRCITKDFRCLRGITPSDVFSACLRYL